MWRILWAETYPDAPWPGIEQAVRVMAEEIKALRMLTDSIVTTALDEETRRRSTDEIQRAHDLVGQYCVEMNDAVTFEHVSALCWILRHEHNTAFAQILETVEARLERLGISVVRLPELVDPAKEQT